MDQFVKPKNIDYYIKVMIEFQFNRILFLALALINDDATKCEDNSDPPDEKKGIINYSHDGFENTHRHQT